MARKTNKHWFIYICIALGIVVLGTYWPVLKNDFINYDDNAYVTGNRYVQTGLTPNSIAWAFTTSHASNWHPLTWLSHMLDCQIYGLNPSGHHLTNLILHIANTLLLFVVLRKMTRALWQSIFVAAAFALHPLHVESVAWVAERKDVLSTFFWFLTMLTYLHYVHRPSITRYTLVILSLLIGLMAKPMLVTLPFVLLLLDYWPLQRFENIDKPLYRLIWEKTPLFAISAISSAVTFVVQRTTGAVITTTELSLKLRIANSLASYIRYITKMFCPSRLAIFYPHPVKQLPMWQAVAAAILLLAITICVIYLAKRYRYLTVGWFWYLGTLVPVIGLVQVGEQSLADRYTYVPLIGLFIVIAWGISSLFKKRKYRKMTICILSLVTISTLSVCTRLQLRHWRNSWTVFQRALKVTENNYIAHYHIAHVLYQQNKIDQALSHLTKVIKLTPYFVDAHARLGQTLFHQGKVKQAVARYAEAVTINPNSVKLRYQFARILSESGRVDLAVTQLKKALQLQSNDAAIMSNLAWFLAVYKDAKFHDPKQAVSLARAACEITKNQDFKKLDNLATAYAADARFADAVTVAEKALQLARSKANKETVEQVQNRLNLFKAGQPYVEKLP